MNKRAVALTLEQYREIITTLREGFTGFRPNERVATALMLEANLGLHISDILRLRLRDIIRHGERYRLAITEQKTGKARVFTVPLALYQFIRCYCLDNGVGPDEVLFPLTERAIWKNPGPPLNGSRVFAVSRILHLGGSDLVYAPCYFGRLWGSLKDSPIFASSSSEAFKRRSPNNSVARSTKFSHAS